MITTDGVFSMDGFIAPLTRSPRSPTSTARWCMVDECHATGFLGATGRGTPSKRRDGPIDIFTGTLGKAMGGALGGFTTAKQGVIELLRQRSRPYLFSNSLPPHVVAAGIKAFEMLSAAGELRERCARTRAFPRTHDRMPASTSSPACTRSAR
jgi:glycine C-acetyltransferase